MSIDPSIPSDREMTERFYQRINQQMDIVFGGTAEVETVSTPQPLDASVLRELKEFSITRILDNELVLVVSRNHPQAKDFRTLETVVEKGESIFLTQGNLKAVQRDIQPYVADKTWKALAEKIRPFAGTAGEFLAQLRENTIVAALIRRSELKALGRNVRFIPARFPWQLDSLLRTTDKIFAASVIRQGELFQIHIREIDAVMRVVGPTITASTHAWEGVPRLVAFCSQQAFAPLARIEEADLKMAQLTIRGGGLILEDQHPARLIQGDVLQPYLRRDDRNGVPTLLQSIPWTYVAVAEQDGVTAQAAIFSGIRSPLEGRKNRRTHKICLRVRPAEEMTELQLGVMRQPELRIPGAEVYRRTPGSDDLTMVAYADWRGITPLNEKTLPVALYEKPAKKEPVASESPGPKAKPEPPEKSALPLRAPLYLYYVKHGNTLLARLPVVTGLNGLEVAELPDDRRRLETEAFIKGIQAEMLDLVARRQILASRIKQKIEAKDKVEAEKLLNELRAEKGYDKMSQTLDATQRRILATDRGPIPSISQKRIDQMFDTTRQMLQRYLQDSLLREMEVAVAKMGS